MIIMTGLQAIKHKQFKLSQPNQDSTDTINLLVLNIMPNKLETESQILNLCSGYSKSINFTFLYPKSHHFKSDVLDHLQETYVTIDDIKDEYYDGLLVTGAPVECIEFEEVDYWEEFKQLLEWSRTHVTQSIYFCWASQAALYADYGIQKHNVDDKISGIFPHHSQLIDPLLDGFGDTFYLPHSRHTTLDDEDILQQDDLTVLTTSKITGPQIIVTKDHRSTFITGHPEYSTETLSNEYFRDVDAGLEPHVPDNYFKQNNPTSDVKNYWHADGVKLFANWLNQIK